MAGTPQYIEWRKEHIEPKPVAPMELPPNYAVENAERFRQALSGPGNEVLPFLMAKLGIGQDGERQGPPPEVWPPQNTGFADAQRFRQTLAPKKTLPEQLQALLGGFGAQAQAATPGQSAGGPQPSLYPRPGSGPMRY